MNDVKINLNSNNSLIFYIKIFKFVNIRCFEANYKTGSRTPIIQVFSIFCHQIPPSSYLFPLPPPISLPFSNPTHPSPTSHLKVPPLSPFSTYFSCSFNTFPSLYIPFPIFLIFTLVTAFPSSLYLP